MDRQHTLFTGCRIVDADIDIARGWILVTNGLITGFGYGDPNSDIVTLADTVTDATGLIAMPGVIDTHVHFREPGLTKKATIASESRAAAAGGVTTFFDMPNTIPPTTTTEAWEDKMKRAKETSLVNYAFFVAATPGNIDWLASTDFTDRPGVKLFMGSTTGASAATTGQWLDDLFSRVKALIAVHAEDDSIIAYKQQESIEKYGSADNVPVDAHPAIRSRQACVESTKLIISTALRHNHRLHVCHISTADELEFFSSGTDVSQKTITAETCPQYVTFDSRDYSSRGTRVKCNPSIKDTTDREALETALATGKIDTIATDHAPHLLSAKTGGALKAASGMPGVQFALPIMLEKTLSAKLTLQSVSRLMSGNPAKIFGIDRRGFIRNGYHADIVFVKALDRPHTITDSDVKSSCGWTPYSGIELSYAVASTWVNGVCVYAENTFQELKTRAAMPVKFKGV